MAFARRRLRAALTDLEPACQAAGIDVPTLALNAVNTGDANEDGWMATRRPAITLRLTREGTSAQVTCGKRGGELCVCGVGSFASSGAAERVEHSVSVGGIPALLKALPTLRRRAMEWDLREAARVVHCYRTSSARASTAVDLLLCADLGVDYLHDHAPPRPLQCPRRQWLDRARQTCTECSRCPDGSGEAEPCSAVADTECTPCKPHEYVSPHDRQCHSCDADQEWDPSRQRCVQQQRNIHQNKCPQQPGHVFLPWAQTCAPCPRHTRQVENRCEPCEVNWQTHGVGETACEPCPGAHVRAPGDSECRECPVGEQAAGADSSEECMPCAGQSVRALGVEACVPCAPGYRAVDGARCEPCEGVDCVPCEDGMYLDATDRRCYECRDAAPEACPEGEQWVCSQCEQDSRHYDRKQLAEQYTVPLREEYEGVLGVLHMQHKRDYAACGESKRLEKTTALLYASDAFLRGDDFIAAYDLCCDPGYTFEKDDKYNLYSCLNAQ